MFLLLILIEPSSNFMIRLLNSPIIGRPVLRSITCGPARRYRLPQDPMTWSMVYWVGHENLQRLNENGAQRRVLDLVPME